MGGANGRRGQRTIALFVAIACVTVGVVSLPLATGDVTATIGTPSATTGATVLQTGGPTASVTIAPNPAYPGDPVTLDATESSAGEGDEIAQCSFDTDGDGTYETESDACLVNQSYETAGEYNVSVRVLTTNDLTATDNESLEVRANENPNPAIAIDPSSPRPGDPVALSGGDSRDADGEIVTYEWAIDGRTLTGETVETAFDATGEYEVVLTVTDDDGATEMAGAVVTVEPNESPSATLVVEQTEVTVGDAVALDASSSADLEGTIVEYRWDLDGDDAIDRRTEVPETTYTVETAGDTHVRVTVVDDRGATDSATVELSVDAIESTAARSGDGEGREEIDGRARSGLVERLDPGVVPLVPDWLVAALLGAIVAGAIAHRRESIPSRVRRLRARVHQGEFRRNVAKKATGFVSKSLFKKVLRKVADGVEASGNAVGEGIERTGRAIKRWSKRVADVLRSLGG